MRVSVEREAKDWTRSLVPGASVNPIVNTFLLMCVISLSCMRIFESTGLNKRLCAEGKKKKKKEN